MNEKIVLMDSEMMNRVLTRIAHEIIEQCKDIEKVALIGIITRGVPMAKILQKMILKFTNVNVPIGKIDISLYRDDLTEISEMPTVNKTEIEFSVKDKDVILCDDVLYTGRTSRAAMEAVLKFGRPSNIRLAIMIDRGHRELPIKADFVGKNVPTSKKEVIDVRFEETDNETSIRLCSIE